MLEYVNNVLYEHPELTMAQIAKKIEVAPNALSMWRRGQPIPIDRAMQIAELVGDDVLKVRDIGIRDRYSKLFQGEYSDFVALLNPNEKEFLQIIREVPLDNPKVRNALKAMLGAFAQACGNDKTPAAA